MRECKLPLRTVLQNFINNVESLESKSPNKEDIYEQEFQELKKLTESLKTHPDFVCVEGEKECNRRKNRYKDILPYDKTRVVLQDFPGIPGSDYINANYIRGASGSRAYIASQGPLPNTVPDFWRMVVECDVQVIIMASNETEGGKHKCECYWVETEGEEKQFGNVSVSFIKSRQVCPDFLVRTLRIKFSTENNKTEERTICQFHYMLWPDHGVPDTVRPLLHMVRLVRDCQASETLPVLVHCSAGCGRTGTICAIDYVWGLLRTGKLSSNLYLLGLVREMRVQRVAMVQTKEQYSLLHQAVKELFRERLSLIDSHPYENVATDGNPISMQQSESKESDYEELLLSHEKQDISMKPSLSQSCIPLPGENFSSTSSSSLTRKLNHPSSRKSFIAKDNLLNLRRSASTSSLDTSKIPSMLSRECTMNSSLASSSFDACHQKFPNISDSLLKTETKEREKAATFYSKTEKEVENNAQRIEAIKREKLSQIASSYSVLPQKKSRSAASFSNHIPLNIDVNLGHSLPPPRSKSPSPIPFIRKNESKCKEIPLEEKRKSAEIVRRPSIQKLRELFEKPPSTNVIECPNGMRLSRSASSVTPRPSLSLQNDETTSLKMKRKGNMGSEQSLVQVNRNKEDSYQYHICPPPPAGYYSDEKDRKSTRMPLRIGITESDSSYPGLGVKRKVSQSAPGSKEEKNLAVLPGVDDRPALPIKKSKSFRWSRTNENLNSSSVRKSPELRRKKTDLNTYFSLDRGKEILPSSRVSKGDSSIKKIANDFFPIHQEGLKLSVYEASHKKPIPTSSPSEAVSCEKAKLNKSPSKPQIPPKKSKNSKLVPLKIQLSQSNAQIDDCDTPPSSKDVQTPLSAPPNSSASFESKEFWDKMQKSCIESIYDELPIRNSKASSYESPQKIDKIKSSSQMESSLATQGNSKDYVNARVLSSYLSDDETPRVSYVPLPTKRESKDKNIHDYANCSVFAHKSMTNKPFPNANNPLYDNTHHYKSKLSPEETIKSTNHSSDYEPVDFGETVTSVDEVFETLNYELIEKKSEVKAKRDKPQTNRQDYYLNKDLDSLAIQVFQDCQAYLLHGDNQSPVPSLMPSSSSVVAEPSQSNYNKISTPDTEMGMVLQDGPVADLEEVKNKVSVPPQGLRNRERRNSYRQAVNTSSSYRKGFEKQMNALKKVHKYEKIWFESMKEEMDEDQKHIKESEELSNDFSQNINLPLNISGKEALFKDKLEALHGLVSNSENKKLPDLSEEELSSKDSGSTSSLLSRSAQSSRSSERVEPIYANAIPGYRSSSSPSEFGVKFHPPNSKGASPYGTLATTTTYPYKPKYPAPQQTVGPKEGSNMQKMNSSSATLPARTHASPALQNIPPPPPKGFINPTFSANPEEIPKLVELHQEKNFYLPPVFRDKTEIKDKNFESSNEERVKRKYKKSSKFPTFTDISSGRNEGKEYISQSDNKRREKCSSSSKQDHLKPCMSSVGDKVVPPSAQNPANPSLCPSVYHPTVPTTSKPLTRPVGSNNINGGAKDRNAGTTASEVSSTDTDDDGPQSKSTSSSSNLLLRKLIGTKSTQATKDDESSDSNKEEKEKTKRRPLSPPGSPRSFTKAFGKLKLGSKSVAANFKSYLSSKGTPVDSSADAISGSPPHNSHSSLQKSVSSGPSVTVFSQVVEDSSLPSSVPKKMSRELPQNFCSYVNPNSEAKTNRARQQYL